MLQEHASGTIPQERKGRTMTRDVNTVAELIVACLEAESVAYMFGMPDEENIRLVAATTGSTIRFILVHHEELAYRLGDDRHAWVQVIRGAMVLNGTSLTAGDGVAISKDTVLQIRTTDAAGLLLFTLPSGLGGLCKMTDNITILGIAGSLRKDSYNRAALRAAQQLAPDDAKIEIFELHEIPPFNQDDEQHPPAKVSELKTRIRAADAILFVTPEYNYSIPGVLKNAIDWASRPYGDSAWEGKPVAVMGASVGTLGTARAQYHLRQVFVFLNMHAFNRPEVMIGNAAQRFDAQGNLTDATSQDLIRQLLHNLVNWTRQLREHVVKT